ncbi:MAG: AMP-binding protein, partial [Actinomycetia bacterium]|nr:AMP-binding protein [Actinomycetes bacterium]
MTAAQVLWETAGADPDRPAVTDLDDGRGSTRTYAQLVVRAASVGGGLLGLGLEPGDRVALLLPNGHAYVDSYLGAVAAG